MRTLDPAIEAGLESTLREAWLVEFDFPTPRYTTTADRVITFDGDDYQPDGLLVAFRGPNERGDGRVQKAEFTLSPEILDGFPEDYQFKRATLYFAGLDDDHEVIDTPVRVGSYYMSHIEIRGQSKGFGASLICYSEISPFRRPNGVLSNGADQRVRFANDEAFDFTAIIEGLELTWGGARMRASGGGGGGGGGGGINVFGRTLQDIQDAADRFSERYGIY
jgi:hypothetical protein